MFGIFENKFLCLHCILVQHRLLPGKKKDLFPWLLKPNFKHMKTKRTFLALLFLFLNLTFSASAKAFLPEKQPAGTDLDGEKDSLLADPESQWRLQQVQKRWTRFSDQKNSLTILPLAVFTRSLHLSYTRYFFNHRLGLGAEGAYTVKLSSTKKYTNMDWLNINGPTDAMAFMPFTEGHYVSLFAKVYIEDKTFLNMFVSVTGFFRNQHYDNAMVTWEENGNRGREITYYDSLNVNRDEKGFKFLFGINPVFPMGKVALDLEAYAGFSIRDVQTQLYHHYHYSIGSYNTPREGLWDISRNQAEERHSPSVVRPQAGIKIGLRF